MLLHMILFLHGFLAQANVPKSNVKEKFEKGIEEFEGRNFQKAIRDFTIVIKADPEFISAYTYRAMAKIEINRLSDALTDLENVLKAFPEDHEAIYLKGMVLEQTGDLSQANKLYTKAINLAPDFTLAYCKIAFTF